jgi:hypothetical protein
MKKEECPICGRPARNAIATYCQFGCGKLVSRARSAKDPNERVERVEAVRRAWQDGVFRCYYTGLELDIVDSASPFYFTFDHVTPRVTSKIVGCSAYINDVKSDCTEEEFKHNILVLSDHFRRGQLLDHTDFKVKHYKRHRQSIRA